MPSALPDLLAAAGATRIDPAHPVWKLADPWWPHGGRARQVNEGKLDILSWLVQNTPAAFLVTDENDEMAHVAGVTASGVPDTWRLTPAIDLKDLESAVLYMGDWSLYVGREPIARDVLHGTHDANPAALVPALAGLRVAVLINSWHDDARWEIAIADPSFMTAAAE